jgi:integrator complex subunit 3
MMVHLYGVQFIQLTRVRFMGTRLIDEDDVFYNMLCICPSDGVFAFIGFQVNFIVPLIRDSFTTVCLNPTIGMGRDFLRLLQSISRIPEIEAIWLELIHNPKSLSPHCNGPLHLLTLKTSRKFLQSRITPEMEKKVAFLTSSVRFGMHKRYQEWFQRQVCSCP